MTSDKRHAAFDDAWVERDALVVRGRAPHGTTPRLAPRRYKSPPAWLVVDVVHQPGDETTDRASDSEEFRLTCPIEGLGASRGLCVAGLRHRRLVPLPAAVPTPSP